MRLCASFIIVIVAFSFTSGAWAQLTENPDFRIRAKFRTPDDGQWGADNSVGNADFRIKSRFMQVYYGGVLRSDEYRFKVGFDYTTISGFDTQFINSPYNTDYDVYINDGFVGRVDMNAQIFGIGELEYDSRNPDPPATLLPVGFPDEVNVMDIVRVFTSSASLPDIADSLPGGTPLFISELLEEFQRGDANQDGKVDEDDFALLASNYDPFNVLNPHVGPVKGDFTGDNRSNFDDYQVIQNNWTESSDVPGVPSPVAVPEPASAMALVVLGGLGLLSGRRHRAEQ